MLSAIRLRSISVTSCVSRSPVATFRCISSNRDVESWTSNPKLKAFIKQHVELCQPQELYICDGSEAEYDQLCQELVDSGVFTPLAKRPRSYWARTDPTDVARVEKQTFICSKRKEDAGFTNNWEDPMAMKERLHSLFRGSMRGRKMFVVPFSMGPYGSNLSQIGVELTDSPYVAVNMQIMTRMGDPVIRNLKPTDDFVPSVHSVGAPLQPGQKDVYWPCNSTKYIVQFPEERLIMSYGSGYGGNALLSKKCFALRIASAMARDQGWLAEHMLILGVTSPQNVTKYMCAAFPSQCGKTNLAMLTPTIPGWKVKVIGDDIAWLKYGKDGQLYAINPENGFFGVAPGTSEKTNPNAMASLNKHVIFTNTGLTPDGDVWWKDMTAEPPNGTITWRNEKYQPGQTNLSDVAHSNARFTAPVSNCPIVDPAFDAPEGVPISAIIFGGRRPSLVPLVYQTFDWAHGTLAGAMVSSETTSAADAKVGELRHDPFAMLPFCGYNMGDYFQHWLNVGAAGQKDKLPKIFHVNWFRQNAENKFVWPGFGENSRVLKWVFDRCDGKGNAVQTAIGFVPQSKDLELAGLGISTAAVDNILKVDNDAWKAEVDSARSYFDNFGASFPEGLRKELNALASRLSSSK